MEERLQEVEAEIQQAKVGQERLQSFMNKREEELRHLEEQRDKGVLRVWSLSHC